MNRSILRSTALTAALALAMVAPAYCAELVIVSGDAGTGLGLEDPTPKAPEGLNPGTSLGEQRTIAYQFAADLWGAVLQSDATIFVGASFQPLACTPTSGTLGSAGTTFVFSDFTPGVVPNTWYPSALSDALAGSDLNPGFIDINSRFNGDIGVNPNCLTGSDWYYGLDGNTPVGKINFLNVVLHEIGHGLGFQGFTGSTGAFFSGRQDIYSTFAYDNVLAKTFPQMTQAERNFSLRNTSQLVWNGAEVTQQASLVLDNRSVLVVQSPGVIAGSYEVGFAGFGAVPSAANFTGTVVAAIDAGGVSNADGCEPISNAAEVAGRFGLVNRGNCTFVIKAANLQAAGAAGMLLANNAAGAPAMGGADPAITIPSLSVSLADGALIRANLPAQVTFAVDPTLYQGADGNGRVRLYAPNPYESGSSFSHYDTSLVPNALMEPANTATLRGNINIDLTPALFTDIGWTLNPGAARIGNCTTNVDVVGDGGLIPGANVQAWSNLCLRENPGSKGGYQSCMEGYKEYALADGILIGNQGGKVMSCAAKIRK